MKADQATFKSSLRKAQGPPLDLSAEREWLRKHRHQYEGQWVCVSGHRLVAAGEDFDQVAADAKKARIESPFIVFVSPPEDSFQIGLES